MTTPTNRHQGHITATRGGGGVFVITHASLTVDVQVYVFLARKNGIGPMSETKLEKTSYVKT